jgi:hypothetical protein
MREMERAPGKKDVLDTKMEKNEWQAEYKGNRGEDTKADESSK